MGSCGAGGVLTRGGARAGDAIYVSGTIGAAAAGLGWCRANPGAEPGQQDDGLREAAGRFLYPEPRVRLGWVLGSNRAVSSCVDLSDGFADAVRQIAEASGLGAIVEAGDVPVASFAARWFARDGQDALAAAIAGGEDYELMFTVPARRQRLVQALAHRVPGLRLTRVGVMTRQPTLVFRRDGRHDALPSGFAHFR